MNNSINDSILTSIKKSLGIDALYTHFDADLILCINSVFAILKQLGVRDDTDFMIEDNTATWGDYLEGDTGLEAVKSYMFLKVRKMFDPSASSAITTAAQEMMDELEFRIQVELESRKEHQNGTESE